MLLVKEFMTIYIWITKYLYKNKINNYIKIN